MRVECFMPNFFSMTKCWIAKMRHSIFRGREKRQRSSNSFFANDCLSFRIFANRRKSCISWMDNINLSIFYRSLRFVTSNQIFSGKNGEINNRNVYNIQWMFDRLFTIKIYRKIIHNKIRRLNQNTLAKRNLELSVKCQICEDILL